MFRLKLVGIAVAIICSLCLFGQVLTPFVSAQLAIDDHPAKKLNVSVSVSIDSLSYDGDGEGVVNLRGAFSLYNFDKKRSAVYRGELRLEIFDLNGIAYLPHAEVPVSGRLEKNDEDAHFSDYLHQFSESISLHMECLSPKTKAGIEYDASANIALTMSGLHPNETWAVPYKTRFLHDPTDEVELQVGIGPTTDGETFSDDCKVDSRDERENWQSLIYTDGLYHAVYWYVKAPEDTSALGSPAGVSWGDGVTRKSTMTTDFLDVDDGVNWVWYEITGYVYRWDLSVYSRSYLVGVKSK